MDGRYKSHRHTCLLFLLVWLLPGAAGATALDGCFEAAAARYDLSPKLLRAIARAESAMDHAAQAVNRDGSRDIGLMQVNSWWLPRLSGYGITEASLWDPCTNIQVGAWILAGNVARYGYTWEAVGAYNAGTGTSETTQNRRVNYARRIYEHLDCDAGGLRCGAGDPSPR
ncbi:lytic transglycosylase domain-containing protein [Thioalbus denitrificans]|uniref:Transglycosylase-like protein with SLT domain n=1 Tax=Thioalbus denitrificans TaxID=547122 RepID=A0A369C4N9_9GAMM|nr:lytic transglycosylase domain-containing protein [Thioalbus denitrificans]RCX28008.1 transglycosylase-like protein with SLT domain [Thioalbus denitrificans]